MYNLDKTGLGRPRTAARARITQGFTLIELMVSLVLGMVVVLGGLIMLSESQVTSATVSDAARLQLKADSVLRNMGFQSSQSGAVELVDSGAGQVMFSNDFTGFNPGVTGMGSAFLHVHGTDNTGPNGSDLLRLSYEDNGIARDCLGEPTTMTLGSGASRVDNEFWLAGGSLMCRGSGGSTAQPIADGVEDLQVTYTVRVSPAGGTGSPSFQTHTAASISAAQWPDVAAITVCLRMAGTTANPSPVGATVGCQGESVAADGKLRRVIRRTFAMRNQVP